MNRRIRSRTYGGVRGRELKGSLLLDAAAEETTRATPAPQVPAQKTAQAAAAAPRFTAAAPRFTTAQAAQAAAVYRAPGTQAAANYPTAANYAAQAAAAYRARAAQAATYVAQAAATHQATAAQPAQAAAAAARGSAAQAEAPAGSATRAATDEADFRQVSSRGGRWRERRQ